MIRHAALIAPPNAAPAARSAAPIPAAAKRELLVDPVQRLRHLPRCKHEHPPRRGRGRGGGRGAAAAAAASLKERYERRDDFNRDTAHNHGGPDELDVPKPRVEDDPREEERERDDELREDGLRHTANERHGEDREDPICPVERADHGVREQ